MSTKNYNSMSAEEQAQWVDTFATLLEAHGERIAALKASGGFAAGKSPTPAVTVADIKAARQLMELLAAWPFAQDFCAKAARYNDYGARIPRLSVYIDKVKEQLAAGITMTDANGKTVAYVSPSAPARRRGRPTNEEMAARKQGRQIMLPTDGPENEKRRRIAALLGLEVVVAGDAPREKNNAELAIDRARRKAEYDEQNPSLFPASAPSQVRRGTASAYTPNGTASAYAPAASEAGSSPSMLMADVYAERIEQERFHLTDLAWLCSDTLKARIEQVREQRVAAEAASERAKLLAEQGAPADQIAPYAQQAQQSIEAYTATYAAVDEELAILHKRLSIDAPFTDRFKARFKGVDIDKVLRITRPYYEKTKSPELTVRIKTLIEQDNPEYAAKLAQQERDKAESTEIIRYLIRKDKDATDTRIRTMTTRLARLRELRGDEVADAYVPILEKAKEDNAQWRQARAAKKAAKKAPSPVRRGTASAYAPAASEAGSSPAGKKKNPSNPRRS